MTLLFHCHEKLFANNNPENQLAPEDTFRDSPARRRKAPTQENPRTKPQVTPVATLEQTLLDLPSTTTSSPPALQGGVIIFQHVVKTGGTTIRDNFKNRTKFPMVDYKEIFLRAAFDKKTKLRVDQLVNSGQKDAKTIFVEIHGKNTPTLVELAPLLKDWKQKALVHKVPFFAFTILRDPAELAVSLFNHFHVWGDPRFGHNMPGTVNNLRDQLQSNPQCLYLFKGERAYFSKRKLYNVTAEDCQQIQKILATEMDWVGDTKNLSKDTLPLLTYLVTGQAPSPMNKLESSNVAGKRVQQHPPLSMKEVDPETMEMIRARSILDQSLYETAVTTNQLKQLVERVVLQKG